MMKRVFGFSPFAILWVFGFFCALLPLRKFDAHFFMVAFVVLTLGVMVRFISLPKSASLRLPKSPFLLLLGGFWVVALNSALFSSVPFISFIFFCFISLLPLSFLFSVVQQNHDTYFSAIYKAGCVMFAGVALTTLVQYYFFPNLLYHGLSHLPLANPNSLGGLLSLGFFAAYGLMVGGKTKRQNNIGLFLSAFIFMALLSTGSRGATLALFGGLSMFALFSWPSVKQHARCHWALAGLMVVGFLLVSFIEIYPNSQTALDVVRRTMTGNIGILQDRPFVWEAVWNIAMDHFWTGIGIGMLFLYYPAYRTQDYETAGLMGHNDPLQFFAEMGVVAPLLFYAISGFSIFKTLQCLGQLKGAEHAAQRLRILIPFCALGALIAHTHISFHFYIVPILFMVGTFMAYWMVQVERVCPSGLFTITKGSLAENTIVKLCVVALLICQILIFVPSQSSELMVRHAKERIQKHQDIEDFVLWINRARKISFYRNGRADALAATVPSGVLASRKTFKPGERERLFYSAKALLENSLRHNNRQASFYYEYSVIAEYAQTHFPKDAAQMPTPLALMHIAVRLDPLHANTRLRLANLLLASGQRYEAYDVLKGGIKWRYSGQRTRAYWKKTAIMALEFSDYEMRDIALKRLKRR